MHNIYDEIRNGLTFNKYEVDKLLFVEYNCPIEEEVSDVWSQYDFIVHVLSGEKTWRSMDGSWTASEGETLFIKKGASIIEQDFDDEFCMLGFFINDGFVKKIVQELNFDFGKSPKDSDCDTHAIEVNNDMILDGYFQSMLAYFSRQGKPSDSLLILKLKELIVNIITGTSNPDLSHYFKSLATQGDPTIEQVMDSNFCYNLSMEDFAKLCNRSLSSFKRDFKKVYDISPGKWLLIKRLDYSTLLLKKNNFNVSQVAFECGFEDLSHFSKVFKEQFGTSPANFRKEFNLV